MPNTIVFPDVIPLSADDIKNCWLNFTNDLKVSGATIVSGTIEDVEDVLTFEDVEPSLIEFDNHRGENVAVGKALLFTATSTEDASGPQTITGQVITSTGERINFKFKIKIPTS